MITEAERERRALIKRTVDRTRLELLDLLCEGTQDPQRIGRRALLLAVGLESLATISLRQSDLARIFGISRPAVSDHLNTLRAKLSEIQGNGDDLP